MKKLVFLVILSSMILPGCRSISLFNPEVQGRIKSLNQIIYNFENGVEGYYDEKYSLHPNLDYQNKIFNYQQINY